MVLACRDPLGRMRRFPLGDHPGLGIADARDAARAMQVEVRKGADPVAEARRKRVIGREAKEGIGTLTALLAVLAASPGPYPAALLFMLLTLARREEVARARWRDIDLRDAFAGAIVLGVFSKAEAPPAEHRAYLARIAKHAEALSRELRRVVCRES